MSVCRIVLCAEYYSVFRYTIYDPARNLYPTEIYGFYHKFPLFGCMKMTLPLRTNGSSSLVFNASFLRGRYPNSFLHLGHFAKKSGFHSFFPESSKDVATRMSVMMSALESSKRPNPHTGHGSCLIGGFFTMPPSRCPISSLLISLLM